MAQDQSPEKAALVPFRPGRAPAALLVLVTAGLVASPAHAIRLDACYERQYDMAHMAAHPEQKVTRVIFIRIADSPDTDGMIYTLQFGIVGRTGVQDAYIACPESGDPVPWEATESTARLTVEPRDGGAIVIRLGPEGLPTWGELGEYIISGSAGDDREFLLRPCG